MNRFGGWTQRNILVVSLLIGMITWPGLIGMLGTEDADLANNGFPFFLIWIGVSLVVFGHWNLYRYTAKKAESAGRSFVAFMVLSIFFPIIMVIVVQFLQPLSTKAVSQGNHSESRSFDVEIRKLNALLKDGLVSQEEFEASKAKILNSKFD
jgi:uncharacterized membrane protein